ncbi:MAG: beta-lactamase family protein [Cyclobacteriaceae bacterium]|nr:beta-lactamase family protein [Cyclobacteriaceae bacterium]
MNRVNSFLISFCLLGMLLQAQPVDTLEQVDKLFSSWNNATPGMAVAIDRNGQLIYNKAFGLADLERLVPNTTNTIFECGSVSKQFTAAAILLLVKEGKLSLSDNVRKYIPELPEYDAPITIQHLLNHTSGLKDWGVIYGLAGWPRSTRVYTQELSFDIVFRQRSLNFTPGSQYSYSNSNYVLLVLIVERVSGQSLAEFTANRFFKPLGLIHTQWRDNFREVIPNRAEAYRKNQSKYEHDMPFENVHGPGGLLTTTADLLRWNKLLETSEILGPEISALRIKPGKLTTGSEIDYAAGLSIGQVNGFKEISHSGATAGYRAWLAYYPEKKLSVAILSNDGGFNPARTGRHVAEVFLGKQQEVNIAEPTRFIDLSETEAKRYEGLFRIADQDHVIKIDNNLGKLSIKGDPVKAVHPDTLCLGRLEWLIYTSNGLLLKSSGRTYNLIRTSAPLSSLKELSIYNGTYTSTDADVSFRIEAKEGYLLVHRKPGDSFKLEPVFKDGFRTGDSSVFEFIRDNRGRITGFTATLSRARHVPFIKTAGSTLR